MRLRFAFIYLAVFSLFAVLIFKLYGLQIAERDVFIDRVAAQEARAGHLTPQRGLIYFTDKFNNAIPAALNKPYPVAFAVPAEIDDASEAAWRIADILGTDAEALEKRLQNKNDKYESLGKRLPKEALDALAALELSGLYISEEEDRFYPLGEIGAHVLGFVGPTKDDDASRGRYGAELYYDAALYGESGREKDSRIIPPVRGEDVMLTIDRTVQAYAEEILAHMVATYGAESGTVIVEEPQTGKIIALGNVPTFDPNAYGASKLQNFLNPAIESVYEPGSVFKVITMAAGIDSGAITPETAYYDFGSLTLNTHTIRNWDLKAHGRLTMTEVIEQSVNTGAAFAESETGHQAFLSYLKKFGFDRKTGIGLPGEVAGSLGNLESKDVRDIHFATASFGQGVSVTPIRLIAAISAIANDGVLMEPFIVTGTEPREAGRLMGVAAANTVTDMMVSAVTKAQIAAIPNYTVAGKTGTAQVPDFKRGGYSGELIHTYVGFAPASNPRFTILFKLDKPQKAKLAGQTVVPAFKEFAEFLLNYYAIPPDNLPASLVP